MDLASTVLCVAGEGGQKSGPFGVFAQVPSSQTQNLTKILYTLAQLIYIKLKSWGELVNSHGLLAQKNLLRVSSFSYCVKWSHGFFHHFLSNMTWYKLVITNTLLPVFDFVCYSNLLDVSKTWNLTSHVLTEKYEFVSPLVLRSNW